MVSDNSLYDDYELRHRQAFFHACHAAPFTQTRAVVGLGAGILEKLITTASKALCVPEQA